MLEAILILPALLFRPLPANLLTTPLTHTAKWPLPRARYVPAQHKRPPANNQPPPPPRLKIFSLNSNLDDPTGCDVGTNQTLGNKNYSCQDLPPAHTNCNKIKKFMLNFRFFLTFVLIRTEILAHATLTKVKLLIIFT
uniref:(northern house mosquito) hypothetical protein n=1 Tax=Culex pipiens TaxID=7175 RepID=A0A8D8CQY5_CULPI